MLLISKIDNHLIFIELKKKLITKHNRIFDFNLKLKCNIINYRKLS